MTGVEAILIYQRQLSNLGSGGAVGGGAGAGGGVAGGAVGGGGGVAGGAAGFDAGGLSGSAVTGGVGR